MKITKRQLRRIIREEKQKLIQESSYEEIMRIRDSGDYSWRDMEYEVVDLMESMQTFPAKDVIEIMYDALDAEDRQDINFWHMMLGNGGHLYQALDGLKATADEEYDPDLPLSERTKRRINELGVDRDPGPMATKILDMAVDKLEESLISEMRLAPEEVEEFSIELMNKAGSVLEGLLIKLLEGGYSSQEDYLYEDDVDEKKKGLWANIHAKKKRGEKSNPRTKAYQDAKKAGQKINRKK